MKNSLFVKFAIICGCSVAAVATVNAQATRTWVSGVGDDVNPCSRTAPCKTFAGAISKTANGGEIDALDPGGFGTVTITKPITIDGSGTFASILFSGTNGVNVNLTTAPLGGQTATVNLRGLSLNGAGTTLGLNGINYLLGANLNVLDCFIFGASGDGIHYAMSTSSNAFVRNTVIKNCQADGIDVGTSGGAAKLSLDRVSMTECGNGLQARSNSRVVARYCVFNNNTGNGIFANSATAGQFSAVSVWDSQMSLNTFQGVQAGNGGNSGSSGVTISQNQIDRNGANGVLMSVGGVVGTFSNNSINGNTVDGCAGCTPIGPGS